MSNKEKTALETQRCYLCIDLKSFYASVECVARKLDPLKARLVVADPARGRTTICLAVSPALKKLGVRNRCRLFEIPEHLSCIVAPPRMRTYMERSADIYGIYLRYVSPDDIHVYSIDECFIDATPYLRLYDVQDPREFARTLCRAVLQETGITATAGIGPNLFLAKVALDVTAKHVPDGIGLLDDESFRAQIWHHRPITDIWNIGPGIARRLAKHGIHDLAGVALTDPVIIRREFGVNAEYLIDHAWGREGCTIDQIRSYKPQAHSLTNGQILPEDYTFDDARIVLYEMVDALALELVGRRLVTDRISLFVGYGKHGRDAPGEDRDGRTMPPGSGQAGWPGHKEANIDNRRDIGEEDFVGEHGVQHVHRFGPHTGGDRRLSQRTNSSRALASAMETLYDETTARDVPIRRLMISFSGLVDERFTTIDLFTDVDALDRERSLSHAMLAIKGRFGGNSLLRGVSLTEKATARERNMQVGGHRA
ncbi:MAG: DNA repair protein [Coriobacteriia bacterium]|nr:DNA repair protein [Coriobacteriia bacterium]